VNRWAGTAKVLRFNWPHYGVGFLTMLGATLLLTLCSGAWTPYIAGGFGLVFSWFVASIVVSHWVYDRSPIARGGWLDHAPALTERIAIFHAGHDEATRHTLSRFPCARVDAYDFFDARANSEGSLRRARREANSSAEAVDLRRLPIEDECIDLALAVFALHEVREAASRAIFVTEIRRVLRAGGRLLVVEHLRDVWNALAYGPGALHFLSERVFLEAFEAGGLRVTVQQRFTPFVRCYRLEKSSLDAEIPLPTP
jgi:SAM-dependent methyltransferase